MKINNKVKDIIETVKEETIPLTAELLLDGVVGSVVPGVVNAVLAYKQKRQERMYNIWLENIEKRVIEIEELLSKQPKRYYNIKNKYFGLISDYVLEEVQEEKIKYLVNGFINTIKLETINENSILDYYDTLNQLRLVDIIILKTFALIYLDKDEYNNNLNIYKNLCIDYYKNKSIKEKLERLGLLISKRDKMENDLYKNIEIMQKVIKDMTNGKKVNVNNNFKNLVTNNSYELSSYGVEFIKFFN